MKKPVSHPEKAVEEIPEVQRFLEESEMLDEFRTAHKQLFEIYGQLIENMNQARDEADKAVRAQKVSCGPWKMLRVQTDYDTEKLRDLIGEQRFLELGGTKSMKITYGMEKAALEAAIARREITDEIQEEIVKETPYYTAPKALKA